MINITAGVSRFGMQPKTSEDAPETTKRTFDVEALLELATLNWKLC